MDAKKILEAANYYKDNLPTMIKNNNFEVNPLRLDPNKSFSSKEEKLNHLLWLAQAIPNLINEGHREKAMRWICFIQGTLWGLDLLTVSEAKNQNRPD